MSNRRVVMIKFIIEYHPKGDAYSVRFVSCWGTDYIDAITAFEYENRGSSIISVYEQIEQYRE